MRKQTGAMMDNISKDLQPHYESATFPTWIFDKLKPLGVTGLQIKGNGAPGLSTLEAGAVVYEMAKRDASFCSFFLVHNCIGLAVIDALGDEE